MSKQAIRRRRARCAAARTIAVAGTAALVAILSAGQALASTAQPDERVLERQGMIDRQATDEGKVEESPQQAPPTFPRRFFKPEPKMDPGPWIDMEPAAPTPAPTDDRPDVAVPVTAAVLLVLALGVLVLALGVAIWWLRHRRPRPEPTT
jgi:hypothetical protein